MQLQIERELVPIPSNSDEATSMPYPVVRLLVLWTIMSGAVLITSNILAARLWAVTILGVTLTFDAGIIYFPIIYALGDMISEIFGRKIADRVTLISCLFNLVAFATFYVADKLPPCPGVENFEFETALSLSRIVILGSVVSYLISQLANNLVFDSLRKRTADSNYIVRALVSSIPAHLLDAAIFNIIAFGGRMTNDALFRHILYAFCTSFVFEGFVLLFEKPYIKHLKLKLQFTNGQKASVVETYYRKL